MSRRFSELVDVPRVQGFTDLFYDATGIPSLVRDLDGTIDYRSRPTHPVH